MSAVSGQQCSVLSPTVQLALPGGAGFSLSVLGSPCFKEKGAAASSGKVAGRSVRVDRAALHKDMRAIAWQLGSVGDVLRITVYEWSPVCVNVQTETRSPHLLL